jgi:hypothetical protein
MAEAEKSQDQVPDSSQDSVPYPFRTTTTQPPLVPNPSSDVPDQPATNLVELTQRRQQSDDLQRRMAMYQQYEQQNRYKKEQGVIAGLEHDREQIKKVQDHSGVNPDDLKKWDPEAESAKYTTPPMQQFGSAGMVFAMLASAFTHQPMTNALNAGAEAMKAIQKGDAESYQRAYEAWRANTDLTLKRHQIEREGVQDAIELLNVDATIGRAKLSSIYSQYNDHIGLFLLENGMDDKLLKTYDDRETSAVKLREAQIKVEEQQFKNTAFLRLQGAREQLRKAQQSGDPQGVQAAADAVSAAQQNMQDLLTASGAGRYGSATNMKAQEQERLFKALEDAHASGDKDAIAKAEQDIVDFHAAFDKPTGGGSGGAVHLKNDEIIKLTKKYEADGLPHEEAFKRAAKEVGSAMNAPTGNEQEKMQARDGQFDVALHSIDEATDILNRHVGAAGLAGKATRLGERISNVFGSDDTDRVQFMRVINGLQATAARLLSDGQGRPLAAEQKKLDNVVAGIAAGDTTKNTLRALGELKMTYEKLKQDNISQLQGTWKPGGTTAPAVKSESKSRWQDDAIVQ